MQHIVFDIGPNLGALITGIAIAAFVYLVVFRKDDR